MPRRRSSDALRPHHAARLTAAEIAALVAGAANWLRVGQPVQITGAPLTFDGSFERRVGRTGVVWRVCTAPFADHVYVNLDLVGAERSEKVEFLELRDVVACPLKSGLPLHMLSVWQHGP